MNAPLSMFLTQFSAVPSASVIEPVPVMAPLVLTSEELAARLDAARAEAERLFEAKIEALGVAHLADKEAALTDARAQWVATEAEALALRLTQTTDELRDMLTERLAAILRPFVVDQVITRTKQELAEALDRLLGDPKQPALSVSGPADLIAALREKHNSAGIDWAVTDGCEVRIVADATRVETCFAAALADTTTAET